MRLIIQIPCFNEEQTLPETLRDIPREIDGVDSVEILIVDDGSSDRTIEVARQHRVDHVVRHRSNRGLAQAFRTGIDHCLRLGADVIVNTDGDNQYAGQDIPQLIAPILAGRADIVIGDRQTDSIAHFTPSKRLLQRWGSALVRKLSRTSVPDTVSGFRAYSREAALTLNVVSSFSYTIEVVMQAGKRRLAIASVPVRTNPKLRQSRLFRNIPHFLGKSAAILVRTYAMFQPLRAFFYLGCLVGGIGLIPIVRFLYFFFTIGGQGHIQSLVLGSALLLIGFTTFAMGLLAELISCNRQLIEMVLEKVRQIELSYPSRDAEERLEPETTFAYSSDGSDASGG